MKNNYLSLATIMALAILFTSCASKKNFFNITFYVYDPENFEKEGNSSVYLDRAMQDEIVIKYFTAAATLLAEKEAKVFRHPRQLMSFPEDSNIVIVDVRNMTLSESVDSLAQDKASATGDIAVRDQFNFGFTTTAEIYNFDRSIKLGSYNLSSAEDPLPVKKSLFERLFGKKQYLDKRIDEVNETIYLVLADMNGEKAGREIIRIISKKKK